MRSISFCDSTLFGQSFYTNTARHLLMLCFGLMQNTGRAPTPHEIAQHLEQPLTRVLLCMRKVQRPINIDAQSGDAERDSLVDQLAASIDEDAADSTLGSFTHTLVPSLLPFDLSQTLINVM